MVISTLPSIVRHKIPSFQKNIFYPRIKLRNIPLEGRNTLIVEPEHKKRFSFFQKHGSNFFKSPLARFRQNNDTNVATTVASSDSQHQNFPRLRSAYARAALAFSNSRTRMENRRERFRKVTSLIKSNLLRLLQNSALRLERFGAQTWVVDPSMVHSSIVPYRFYDRTSRTILKFTTLGTMFTGIFIGKLLAAKLHCGIILGTVFPTFGALACMFFGIRYIYHQLPEGVFDQSSLALEEIHTRHRQLVELVKHMTSDGAITHLLLASRTVFLRNLRQLYFHLDPETAYMRAFYDLEKIKNVYYMLNHTLWLSKEFSIMPGNELMRSHYDLMIQHVDKVLINIDYAFRILREMPHWSASKQTQFNYEQQEEERERDSLFTKLRRMAAGTRSRWKRSLA